MENINVYESNLLNGSFEIYLLNNLLDSNLIDEDTYFEVKEKTIKDYNITKFAGLNSKNNKKYSINGTPL